MWTCRIKVVPDNDCNADGQWIELKHDIVSKRLFDGLGSREKWDYYNSQAPRGCHAVAVEWKE